jgi:DHA1 family multidrug resistance protein-like MFS transporter
MNATSRKNVYILAFTLMVVMLGYGMVMPVMPFYIERLGAGGKELGWLVSTYSLMQLIFAPLWGTLSDRIGRKRVIAIGVLGYAVTLFLFGLATQFWMLFLTRTLSGILSSATMPTSMAYVGDNAPEGERSAGMGLIGAATGVGIVGGPLLGGLLSARSLSLPFFFGAGLAGISFVLVLALLPESRGTRTPVHEHVTATSAAIRRTLLGPTGLILLLIFIMSFGLANFQGIIGLYVLDKFGATTSQVGTMWMVIGAVLILAQGALAGPLTKRYGEPSLIRVGLIIAALACAGVALAGDFAALLWAVGFLVLALAAIGPALNSYVSRLAGDRQGAVMGFNSASASLGRVVGPLLAGFLFDRNMDYPFYVASATLLVGTLLAIFFLRGEKRVKPQAAAV